MQRITTDCASCGQSATTPAGIPAAEATRWAEAWLRAGCDHHRHGEGVPAFYGY